MKTHRVPLCRVLLFACVSFVMTVSGAPGWAATATTTTLVVNPASSVAFQHPVKLVATVTDGAGNPVKLGTVSFYADKALLGTVHLVGNGSNGLTVGSATLWTRLLTVGTHSLTAAYNGITADSPSTSAGQPFTVTAAAGPYPSITTLTSTGNTNGQYGLTATVGGFGPASLGGSVTINDTTTGTALGTGAPSGGSLTLFALSTSTNASLCPSSVASGDFNNDGNPDLVVAGSGSGGGSCLGAPILQTLLGNGDGTFAPGSTMPFSGSTLLVADFNVDGNLDIYDGNNIYLGNGDGTFQLLNASGAPVLATGSGIGIGDLNGDGIPDFVIGVVGLNSTLGVFLGKGDGTFGTEVNIPFSVDTFVFPTVNYYTGGTPVFPATSLSIGDLNHDGKDDVVVNAGGVLEVFLSSDDVSAPVVSRYYNDNSAVTSKITEGLIVTINAQVATSVTLADINGDGNLDAIIGSAAFNLNPLFTTLPNGVGVLLGDGNGGFQGGQTVGTDQTPSTYVQIAVGDIDYDGIPEVIAYDGSGWFLVPVTGNTFPVLGAAEPITQPPSNRGSSFADLVASDFLNDGSLDFVASDLSKVTPERPATGSILTLNHVTVPEQGAQSVTASYSGDSNFAPSTSKAVTLDSRTPVGVSLSLTSSSVASAFVGYPVSITASIVVPQSGLLPTGSVQFYDGLIAVGSPVILSAGSAITSVSFTTLGSQSLTAAYSGDSNYQPAISPVLIINAVNSGKPTLSISAPRVQAYGTPLALTVTMQTGFPGPAPTGTVSLSFGGTSAGQDVLTGSPPFSLPFTWNPTTPSLVGVYTMTASYSGDAVWSAASTQSQVVIQGTTILSISTGGPTTVSSGAPFIITGQLTTAEVGPPLNGTITLLDNGVSVATSTLVGAQPPFVSTFTVNTTAQPLSAGTHLFSLQFSGPPNTNEYWQASTSPNLSVTVNGASVTALSSNLPSTLVVLPGSTVQFTSKVTPIGNTASPTGTVQFYDGTAAIGAPVAVLNGTAAFTSTAFAVGSHSVTAVYSGDTNYSASTSSAIAFTVPAKGTVSVTPQIPSQIMRGSPLIVIVNIGESPAALGPVPTGTVTLLDSSGGTIGSGAVNAQGMALITLDPTSSVFVLGPNTVTAQYSGDSLWGQSTSTPVTFQLVLGQPVFSAFSCSANSSFAAGTSFSCVATFTAWWTRSGEPAPTNPINLLDNGTVIASKTLTGSSPYAIAFTLNSPTSPLSTGTHAFSMSFAQDAHWLSATSGTITITISANIPTFTLSSNLGSFGSVVQGTTIIFTATATGAASVPTGTVQFYVDGTAAGSPVTMSGGVATYSTSTLVPGTHQVTAAYSGDTHYNSTTTNGVVSVVTQGPDSLSLAVQGSATVNTGTPIIITGSLAVGALGPPPTGTVSLLDGNTVLQTASLSGNAPVSVSFNVNTSAQPLTAGTHSFSLKYGGETHWAANVSTASSVTVMQSIAATATAVSSTQSAVPAGSSVTLTAAVSSSQSSPAMTGTVQFYDGSTALGPAQTLTGGAASYTATSLADGSHSITAAYSGDANYKASTSAAFTVEIQDFALQSSAPTLTVNPGGTATVQLQVTAEGGFDAATKFTCSGVPAQTTCTLNPSQITGSGTVTASIVTSSGTSAENRSPANKWPGRGGALLVCLVVLILPGSKRRKMFTSLVMVLALLLVSVQGCGGNSGGSSSGGGSTGTPAGTYTITITGTTSAGNTTITHNVLVKLTVN